MNHLMMTVFAEQPLALPGSTKNLNILPTKMYTVSFHRRLHFTPFEIMNGYCKPDGQSKYTIRTVSSTLFILQEVFSEAL